jgi:putative transposase
MGDSITVTRTYKYRLYRNDKHERALRQMIFIASLIWNHFIALQRRYYRLTGKYISLNRMNDHALKLRRTERFVLWRGLHSQACQNVCRRVDEGYLRFFEKLVKRRPKFRKAKKYKSFTLPQLKYSYQLVTYNQNQPKANGKWTRARGVVKINGQTYKFVQHRPMIGQIKTLTVKRDAVGRLWLVFTVEETIQVNNKASTGKSGGFDFGLKTFLVDDEGRGYTSPQFFKQGLRKTRKLNREHARKVEGSNRRKRARRVLAKHQAHMANKRRDHHFKLAHQLCDEYDVLYFEDLNLAGMKKWWGRKVSDLAFGSFLEILEWVALKRGKTVIKIDRFERTTRKCSKCKRKHELTLKDRTLRVSVDWSLTGITTRRSMSKLPGHRQPAGATVSRRFVFASVLIAEAPANRYGEYVTSLLQNDETILNRGDSESTWVESTSFPLQ